MQLVTPTTVPIAPTGLVSRALLRETTPERERATESAERSHDGAELFELPPSVAGA